jgi:hypothetical protein
MYTDVYTVLNGKLSEIHDFSDSVTRGFYLVNLYFWSCVAAKHFIWNWQFILCDVSTDLAFSTGACAQMFGFLFCTMETTKL